MVKFRTEKAVAMENDKISPCPFCGSELDVNDPDVLHREPFGWVDKIIGGFMTRQYLHRNDPLGSEPHGQCWSLNCPTIYGGCGVGISGDSREETIQKWERRIDRVG